MVDGLCVFGVFMLHLVSGIGLLLRGALLVEENGCFFSISIDEDEMFSSFSAFHTEKLFQFSRIVTDLWGIQRRRKTFKR